MKFVIFFSQKNIWEKYMPLFSSAFYVFPNSAQQTFSLSAVPPRTPENFRKTL